MEPTWGNLKASKLAHLLMAQQPQQSVMDNYQPTQPLSGLLDYSDPAVKAGPDAIGPPTIAGGLLSLDPTDYVGPQTLGKLAAGLKGLLAGGAAMPLMGGMIRPTVKELAQDISSKYGIRLNAQDRGKDAYLSILEVPENMRGKGIGTEAMKDFTEGLDALKKPSTLAPSPIDSRKNIDVPKWETDRLINFYKKFGYGVSRDDFDNEFGRFVDMSRP